MKPKCFIECNGVKFYSPIASESWANVIKENDTNECIEKIEAHYGSGKAQLVSDILNADKETIERVLKELEK